MQHSKVAPSRGRFLSVEGQTGGCAAGETALPAPASWGQDGLQESNELCKIRKTSGRNAVFIQSFNGD